MKTMAFETVGRVCVAVHTTEPPDQKTWDASIVELKAAIERIGIERIRSVAFTEGGGPSFSQRQQINTLFSGRGMISAVVSSNSFIRGIVTALAVFNRKIKVFRPDAVDEAFRYLGLSESESKAVRRATAKLQTEIGLRSGQGS
jgi:hypothetical protein